MTHPQSTGFNEDISPHIEFSNGVGGIGSGGSMSNKMYRNICQLGTYEPLSGRSKRRMTDKYSYGKCLSKRKKFWNL